MTSPTPPLPKVLTNTIYKAVESKGLKPSEFDWINVAGEFRITHRESGSYFAVGLDSGSWVLSKFVRDAPPLTYTVYTWPTVVERLNLWLYELKIEINTPDLWAELRRDPQLFEAASTVVADNSPFTTDEKEEIATSLQELANDV